MNGISSWWIDRSPRGACDATGVVQSMVRCAGGGSEEQVGKGTGTLSRESSGAQLDDSDCIVFSALLIQS